MPAIITDQFRIANAQTFVQSFSGIGTTSYYYAFLSHPEGNQSILDGVTLQNYKSITGTTPDAPKDSFQQENLYHDTMLFAKRITSSDIALVIPNRPWTSGETYDMYRNDIDIDNRTNVTSYTNLYDSRFYAVNDEFKVYICINNGSIGDENGKLIAKKSLQKPTHVDLSPRPAGDGSDGYLWKYLFTIKPADIIKFGTDDFIPVPSNWGDSNSIEVKNAAKDGKIETVLVKKQGQGYKFGASSSTVIDNVPIYGDGDGTATASVTISAGKVTQVDVTKGGEGYTRGHLELNSSSRDQVNKGPTDSGQAEFQVIIPPQGGHGADIYRELGAFRVLLHSKFDDTKDDLPDYVTRNNFSRVGIIKNPIKQDATGSSSVLLNTTTATTLGAIKLAGDSASTEYPINRLITQTQTNGDVAVGYVAEFDKNTNVLRYYQPVGLSTLSDYGYKLVDFKSEAVSIQGSGVVNPLQVDTGFNASSVNDVNVGVSFVNGIAKPEIKKYSGDIIYIDNRNKVTRSSTQKEEIKIVIEF